MNVLWGILHRIGVGIFDPSKSMATVTENRTKGSDSSFSHVSQMVRFSQILTWVKSAQHDEINLWSNFHSNMFWHVEVIALFLCFFAIFNVISFEK